MVDDELLDTAAEHATTHYPAIDDQLLLHVLEDDHRNQTVVAEAIGEPQVKRRPLAFVAHHRFAFADTVAAGRQVELIAALQQLLPARQMESVEAPEGAAH